MSTRVSISLACSVCGTRNYKTTRTVKPGAPPLELRKYCRACNQHTVHRETK